MNFSGQVYPNDTVGYFRIASDTGRQPIEPLTVGEFKIGSQSDCQLRLGNPGVPDVLALLEVTDTATKLTTKASSPTVCVNGSPVTTCELNDGDLVEICDHRLLFRRLDSESRITLDEATFDHTALSAEELVDRLGEQLQVVEKMSSNSQQRVVELFAAAANSVTERQDETAAVQSENSETSELLLIMQQQHDATRIRLDSLTEVLNSMIRQQKTIANALEILSDRIQDLDGTVRYAQRRPPEAA